MYQINRIKSFFGVAMIFSLYTTLSAVGENQLETPTVVPSQESLSLNPSLSRECDAAIQRGMDWLITQQQEDGHWSNAEFPALTALAVWALVKGGASNEDVIKKGLEYILSCAKEDGSIYREAKEERKGGGLSNYNTALCMIALHSVSDPKLTPVIQKARQFIAGSQHFGEDLYRGGMGYDAKTGRPYADLSNSYIAYEAMKLTESVESLRSKTDEKADLDWDAAVEFLQRIQNRPESNDQNWASDEPQEKGGFVYKPDSSMAGAYTNETGAIRLRSYGSMTYAGFLSFIYSKVDKKDPRVQSAYDWVRRYWTLEENPGMGAQGLYYYYNVLAKALVVYGEDEVSLLDGNSVFWRVELIKKLLDLQKIDPKTGNGYWVNHAGRWWEADPILVTSYALLSLSMAKNR